VTPVWKPLPEWRLLLDQNIRIEVRDLLTSWHVDAIHASDVALSRALDPEILDYAIRDSRTLVTLDADFGDFASFPLPHAYPGVIRLRLHPALPQQVFETLIVFLNSHTPEAINKCLVVITKNKVRIRNTTQ
jgi:predicted nuclease of predicted toxin-antitoxin system